MINVEIQKREIDGVEVKCEETKTKGRPKRLSLWSERRPQSRIDWGFIKGK